MKIEWASRNTTYNFQGEAMVEYWGASNEEIARSNTDWLGKNAVTVTREVSEWKEA